MIQERLKELRAQMQERGIDIYIVPTSDFHQSDRICRNSSHHKRRGWTVDRRTLFYPGRKTVRRQYRQAF